MAVQGSLVSEQGMTKTWLGGVVTLEVLRRNYLIFDSSQDSILAAFVSNRRNASMSFS